MKALLKKSCPTCTPSSQKTYFHSIQALSLFAGRQTIPSGPAWLNSALLKKVRALPLQKYKRFTIAGVKALNAYGKTENKAWWEAMRDATDKYTKLRMSGKRTKREAERWPKGGYSAIRIQATALRSPTSRGTQTDLAKFLGAIPIPEIPDYPLLFSPRPKRRPRRRTAPQRCQVLDPQARQVLEDSHRTPQDDSQSRADRTDGGPGGWCCIRQVRADGKGRQA